MKASTATAKASVSSKIGLAALLAAAAFAVSLLGAASASAAPTAIPSYFYSHSFGTKVQEGQMDPPNVFSGGQGNAVAVDPQTGYILVAEPTPGQIGVYAPESGPEDLAVSTFGDDPAEPQHSWTALAVAPNGDLYAKVGNTDVARFVRNPGSPPTYTRDTSFEFATANISGPGFAVDPATGDLLIAGVMFPSSPGSVYRIDPSGDVIDEFTVRGSHLGESFPKQIGATADGTIFVVDSSGSFIFTVNRFTANGELLSRTVLSEGDPALEPRFFANDLIHDGIDMLLPESGGALRIDGLNSVGKQIFTLPFPSSLAGSAIQGMATDPGRGRLYAVTSGQFGGVTGVHVFEPTPYPGIEVPTVSEITSTSVHLATELDAGEVEPGKGAPSGSYARFEYSEDGGQTWTKTPDQDDSTSSSIEADLSGLLPNFTYLVRAVAGQDKATHVTEAASFTTATVAPIVVTSPATDLTETVAVLNGTINPAGLQTTYYFEYGASASYGSRVPVAIDAVAGKDRATESFSRTLTGLQPGTTYHYRIVAINSIGASFGEDRTFTTAASGSIAARAYEQVTPVDKNGGTIIGYSGAQISTVGSQLAYMVLSPGEAKGSPLFARAFSRRTDADWEGAFPIDPPLNVVRTTLFTTTLGISPDFSHAFVVSNKALAPGAIEDATNLYVEDLAAGTYALVASSDSFYSLDSFTSLQQNNKFIWGSPDYSTIIFSSLLPLTEGVNTIALYRWTESGGLQIESKLPGGATANSEFQLPTHTGTLRTVSDDGSRDYFSLQNGPEAGIYLNEDGVTRALSVSRRGSDAGTLQPGELLGISRNGRYAFFASLSRPLTDDVPDDPMIEVQPHAIYRYDAETDQLEFTGGFMSNQRNGFSSLGVSASGDTLYFLAPPPGNPFGDPHVEVWRDGQLHQIAIPTDVVNENAFITPDGRYLAIGRDSLERPMPVYLYDADAETLTCASCRSDGTDPGGATVPWGEHTASNSRAWPLDDQGDLFFTSEARLIAADTNGTKDVYEFSDGKLRLVTPGNQPFDAVLADVSADGRDVYFSTAQALVSRDTDQSTDIYDARIGGGLPSQNPPEPQLCIRDDCKATPNAAAEPRIGGSELLRGPGNVKSTPHKKKGRACPKGKRAVKHKQKTRCVKAHPKKAHPKKANHHRRQGR